jgi:hypothetical protein
MFKKVKEYVKRLIKKIFGPVAQSDRATAFNDGACMWKVEKVISKGDYLYAKVSGHPNATKDGYVLYHRIVMENHLGRLLSSNEVVHHKDGNKKNNVIDNLEVLSMSEHSKLHKSRIGRRIVRLKCPQCGKEFTRYENQTHLVKPSFLNCTFCSRSCSGKFSQEVRNHGITHTMEDAISENVIERFIAYGKKPS